MFHKPYQDGGGGGFLKKLPFLPALAFVAALMVPAVPARAEGAQFSVTGVIVNEITDGAVPFDADNNPGNDSGPNNRVVRTFDNVRYTVETAMNMKKGASVRSLSTAVINVELSIPCKQGEFGFAASDMGWLNAGWTETYENGNVVLKGKTTLKQVEGADPVPGTAAFTVSINARAARHGQMLTPTFTIWADGDDKSAGKSFTCGTSQKTADGQTAAIRVSCTAKGLDACLAGSSTSYGYISLDQKKMSVDPFSGGSLAQVQAVGVGLSLRSDSEEKGIKGQECPTGDISFDLEVTNTASAGTPGETGIWDYSNMDAAYYKTYTGVNGRQMNFITSSTGSGMPANNGKGNTSCEKGGTWTMTRIGPNKYHFVCHGYEITDYFPRQHTHTGGGDPTIYGNQNFHTDRNFFSAMNFDLFQYIPGGKAEGTASMSYKITNLQAVSVSGRQMKDVYPATDTASGSVNMIAHGQRKVTHTYNLGSGGDSTNYAGAGRSVHYSINAAVRERGDTFIVRYYLDPQNSSALGGYTWAADFLFKFDDQIFEPVAEKSSVSPYGGFYTWGGYDNSFYGVQDTSAKTNKIMYAALKDRNGFGGSEELMRSTVIADCVFYDTLEDLKAAGKTCIGYLVEGRNMRVPARHYWSNFMCECRLTVRDDAPIDAQGWCFGGLESWTGETSAGKSLTVENSHGPGGKALPEPDFKAYDNGFKGATWSSAEEGREYLTNGGPYGTNGSLTLIIGEIAKAGIAMEDGKSSYNLNYGERTADVVLVPALTSKTSSFGRTTMNVRLTLPKHLTYKAGNCFAGGEYVPASGSVASVVLDGTPFEPKVEATEDGGQTLTWTYNGILPNEAMESIHIKLDIGTLTDPVNDVTESNNPLTMSVRSWSTYGAAYGERKVSVKVIKALATSLYFKAVEGAIEKNEDAQWRMVLTNYSPTDSKPWTMYVATPYSGDERDSGVTGRLPLKAVTVDTARCPRSIAGGFHVYVTTDASVRNYSGDRFDAKQMDAIKGGWTEVQPSKNGSVWTYNIGKDVTAIKFAGSLIGAREAFEYNLVYDPASCVGGDVFMNSVSVYSERFPSTVFSAPSDVNVVNRILSGFAYNDRNKNRYKDLGGDRGDVVMAGVKLRLLKADGSRMTDVDGKEIPDCVTDKNGRWKFEDFGPGAVKVCVVPGTLDAKYELAPYLEYGTDAAKKDYLKIDNDFKKAGTGMEVTEVRVFDAKEGYGFKPLFFRTADEMNPPVQEIADIGLGLAVYWSDLTVEKVADDKDMVPSFGPQTFIFKAEGTVWDGRKVVYYIPVTVGKNDSQVAPHNDYLPAYPEVQADIEDIPGFTSVQEGRVTIKVPTGDYVVTELDKDGWEFLDFITVNGTVDGDKASLDLLINEKGLAHARNWRTDFSDFIDNRCLGNKLKAKK